MLYAPLQLNYLTTTLYETELWYMDMGRCLIPKPSDRYKIEENLYYYYIELDSLAGRLLLLYLQMVNISVIIDRACKCPGSNFENRDSHYMIFESG